MSHAAFAKEIVARLRSRTNSARQRATAGYYPSAQENLGVSAPHMRAVVREFKPSLKGKSASEVIALAQAIIDCNTLEGRQCAYELLMSNKAAREALDATTVRRLGQGIDNWASVDGFCCHVAGRAWREGRLSDAEIARWARSKDRWWRRAALVSTVPLNTKSKGGKGDIKRTLAVCEMLVADHDDMVAKAVSWALRELVPWDEKSLRAFLKKHEAKLAKRVLREVGNKLRTGRKSGRQGRHICRPYDQPLLSRPSMEAITSAMMDTASSAGVCAPMSRPTGHFTRSQSLGAAPRSSAVCVSWAYLGLEPIVPYLTCAGSFLSAGRMPSRSNSALYPSPRTCVKAGMS